LLREIFEMKTSVKSTSLCLILWAISVASVNSLGAESLYIGDILGNSVKRFDATTGVFLGDFVAPGSNGLFGPRGMVFDSNHDLVLVDQNVGQPTNGEVLRFSGVDGSPDGILVPDSVAPLAPRGAVLSPDRQVLYVADMGDFPDGPEVPGSITRYNATTGSLIDQLATPALDVGYHPRGLVFGSDGMLYASNFEPPSADASASILRFNPTTGAFVDEFVARNSAPFYRGEGITFSPDGDLFAIGFRKDASDVDRILQFDGTSGALIKTIETDEVGGLRNVPSQGLLFGPGGDLYVPVLAQDTDPNTGAPVPVSSEIRRYDTSDSTFDLLVQPGGELFQTFYLTFDSTDPSTLAYVPEPTGGLLFICVACAMAMRRRGRGI
jgi:DNA-binding beta-propeller fold protein YncE